MDPYLVVDFDNIFFGRTLARKQTVNPIWGETLTESVQDAQMMQLTLFHSSLIPPDNFISHAQIYVSEMMQLNQQGHEEHEVPPTLLCVTIVTSQHTWLCIQPWH